MWVASNLPQALVVEHNGCKLVVNGANVGFDPDNLPKNGLAPDTAVRFHAHGLTEFTGPEADAFKDWFAISGKGEGPVRNGAIVIADNEAGAKKAAKDNDTNRTSRPGLDPAKDLPEGVETKKD